MSFLRVIIAVLLIVTQPFSLAFSEGEGPYADGVYDGEYSFVKVQVTVKGGDIADIKMLHHGGGGEKYAKMIEPLLTDMVKKQSTYVDSVTGATVSSFNAIKAVNNALEKAKK